MPATAATKTTENTATFRRAWLRPGDLVTTRSGYPTLYEVLAVEGEGVLRVRGLNWAPGYSACLHQSEVRPVTGRLADKQRAPG